MIYKRDTAGKTRTWDAEIQGDKYRIHTGILDGKTVTSNWKQAKPKNVGRANETSAQEQAAIEVEAIRQRKLRVDYHESLDSIDVVKTIKPMLATKYSDRFEKLNWSDGYIAQPKLDGIRMIATANGLFTRTGSPITTMPHIEKALSVVFEESPDLVLDGELYNHDMNTQFQRLVSLIRRENPTPEQALEAETYIQYHVYDIASGVVGTYRDRHMKLTQLSYTLHDDVDCIEVVDYTHVNTLADLKSTFDEHLSKGYEGTMVRDTHSDYQMGKRSASLMKHKEFDDSEFIVVGFEQAEGNWIGTAKKAIIRRPDGNTDIATMKGTVEHLRGIWANPEPWIGKQATVRYFGFTDAGNLRFPTVQMIHTTARI